MNQNTSNIFTIAVESSDFLPDRVRNASSQAKGIEIKVFDHSYLEFLDQQIELEPRGPEWTDRLRRRRSGLSAFCDRQLISGRIQVNNDDFTIYVDTETGAVIYWEEYKEVFDI
jgi:hypothetical protein